MRAKSVASSQVFMTEIVLPTHINSLGTIFGGVVMSWVDIAASISGQRHCLGPVVTASIDTLNFIKPVYTGWIVNLKSSVNLVGKTSMEIGVRVDGENAGTGEYYHMASAYLTFVALGINGRPTQVPELLLESPEEIRRNAAAVKRREARLIHRR